MHAARGSADERRSLLGPALAASLAFALYLPTLALSAWAHDAGELTAAAATMGIGHPAGSPLYCLVLKLFTLLVPCGSVAARANLFSAVAGAGAVGLTAHLIMLEGLPTGCALGVALAFAWSRTFWSIAVTAEVYSLNMILLATTGICLARARRGDGRWLRLMALAWGLLLANYVAYAALTVPLLVLIVLFVPREARSRRVILAAATLLTAGISVYLYLPVRMAREPTVNWDHLRTATDLFDHLRSQRTQERAFELTMDEYATRLRHYATFPVRDLGPLVLPLIALALYGIATRPFLLCFGLTLALFDAAFVVLLDNSHLESEAYGLPTTWGLALAAASGATRIAVRRPRLLATASLSAAAALGLANFSANDRHDTFFVEDEARALLAALPQDAILVTHEDSTTGPLLYLTTVEGLRPDVAIYDHWGNVLLSAYPDAVHRIPRLQRLRYMAEHENALVLDGLRQGRAVVWADPLLDYEPAGFRVVADHGVGIGELEGSPAAGLWPEPLALPPRLGAHAEEDWMVRQLVALRELRWAEAELEAGRVAEAKERLRRAQLRADLWELHAGLSQKMARLGMRDDAVEEARRAVAMRPSLFAPRFILARMALQSGALDEAIAASRAALALDASSAECETVLGMALASQGKLAEARAELLRAAALDPEQPSHLVNLTIVERRLGMCSRARRRLDDAAAHEPFMPREIVDAIARQREALRDCHAR